VTISGEGDNLLPKMPAFNIYQHFVRWFKTLLENKLVDNTEKLDLQNLIKLWDITHCQVFKGK